MCGQIQRHRDGYAKGLKLHNGLHQGRMSVAKRIVRAPLEQFPSILGPARACEAGPLRPLLLSQSVPPRHPDFVVLGHHTIPAIATIAAAMVNQDKAEMSIASMCLSLRRDRVYYTHGGRSGNAMLGK